MHTVRNFECIGKKKKKMCELTVMPLRWVSGRDNININIHIESSRIKILDLWKRTWIHNKILKYLNMSLRLYYLPDLY